MTETISPCAYFKLQLLQNNMLDTIGLMLDPLKPVSVASKALDLISGLLYSRDEEFELIGYLMEEDNIF